MFSDTKKSELITAIFRFKKVNTTILSGKTLRMNEVVAMAMIEDSCLINEGVPLVTAIGEALCITQSAVSQLLATLEKKGYVKRGIHEHDKRKYLFELTEQGQQATKEMMQRTDRVFESLYVRFGNDRLSELVQVLNEYSEIAGQIQNEIWGD